MSNIEDQEAPTMGRMWTKVDLERLLDRMDEEVASLGEEADSFYRHHFCEVVSDPEPKYQAAFERAIYKDFAYLKFQGQRFQQDNDYEIMADDIFSMLHQYLMLGVDEEEDETDDDEIMSLVCFDTRRSCKGGEEEEICVICQDGLYQPEDSIATIACYHEFHRKCIARWLRETDRCPLCNAKPY